MLTFSVFSILIIWWSFPCWKAGEGFKHKNAGDRQSKQQKSSQQSCCCNLQTAGHVQIFAIVFYQLAKENRNTGIDCCGRTGKMMKIEGLIYKERLKWQRMNGLTKQFLNWAIKVVWGQAKGTCTLRERVGRGVQKGQNFQWGWNSRKKNWRGIIQAKCEGFHCTIDWLSLVWSERGLSIFLCGSWWAAAPQAPAWRDCTTSPGVKDISGVSHTLSLPV